MVTFPSSMLLLFCVFLCSGWVMKLDHCLLMSEFLCPHMHLPVTLLDLPNSVFVSSLCQYFPPMVDISTCWQSIMMCIGSFGQIQSCEVNSTPTSM